MATVTATGLGFARDKSGYDSKTDDKSGHKDRHDDGSEDNRDR